MTQPRTSWVLLRAIPLVLGVTAVTSLVLALPTARRAKAQDSAQAARAIVSLTEVGTFNTTAPMSIVVYTTGGGQVGLGTNPPTAIADTLRLIDRLPAMTADVTDGDVHIELRSPGAIRMGGTATGGPARALSATGRHIVLLKGGGGIQGGP